MKWLKRGLKGAGALAALLALAFLALWGAASHKLGKSWPLPYPKIQRATSPEAIARGGYIFRTQCVICHANARGDRAAGHLLDDWPAFIGTLGSANLTSHETMGIAKASDEELARVLRYGISRDGRLTVMGTFGTLGDDDVAALIGFMRSDDPLFQPDPAPRTEGALTPMGKIVLAFVVRYHVDEPLHRIEVPQKGVTLAYGHYMADGVFHCYGCHTPSFTGDPEHPELYGGGIPYQDHEGQKFMSSNLTQLDGWTLADFTKAVRTGVTPKGEVLRWPMPTIPELDDVDAEAMWLYLASVKKQPPVNELGAPRPSARPSEPPEKSFVSLGCTNCHGEGAPFRSRLKGAVGKTDEEIARWIRNPQAVKPGTPMPTYESVLDEQRALALARFAKTEAAKVP